MSDDKLKAYKEKRDFRKTKEPKEGGKGKRGQRMFVIQKHDASRLHYDFRLEIDGVLKSWAIPKGPSTNPADKRLSVETEDHPISYADFEGVIPEDEYGGGTVMVWDTGTYKNLKKHKEGGEMAMEKAYEQGTIEVELRGKKIKGGYALRRFKKEKDKQQWLLIKMKDDQADARRNPTSTENKSVKTGRTMKEIEQEEKEESD